MKSPRKRGQRGPTKVAKLDMNFILTFYDAYCRTTNMAKVASTLNTSAFNLEKRIQKYPDLQAAKNYADQHRINRPLSTYVFESLSKDAQETWKRIQTSADKDTIQKIFSRKTKQIRQELFIYALVHSSYDLSSACRMVGMDRVQLQKWKHDLEFLQLMEEIQWHKKNYFETALVGLVEERHPGAVMFVNRTLNADRGYGDKLQVEHSGSISTGFTIDQLDLDIDTRRKILQAIRDRKQSTPALPPGPTITLPRAA